MIATRVERLTAARAGRIHARAGRPATACPYPADTPRGRVLRLVWLREYLRHTALRT